MTAAPRPLRPGVTIQREGAHTWLVDPAQALRVRLDEGTARLATLLDGGRDLPALAAALSAPLDAVRGALAALDGLFALDDERGRARAQAAQGEARAWPAPAREASPPLPGAEPSLRPLHVLPDDRFDCHACGYCCSNDSNFGPIRDAERQAILESGHDWTREIPGVRGPEDLFDEAADGAAPEGAPPLVYLRKRDGRCVFLAEDGLCLVHLRVGYERKPHMCRAFPFAFAETPEGTFAFTRNECRSLHRSREGGTLLAAQAAALRALAAEPHADPIRLGGLVPWSGPIAAPYPVVRALRAACLHALEARPDGLPPGAIPEPGSDATSASIVTCGARLSLLRDAILGVSARLGGRPGEVEIAAARAFAEGRAAGPLGSPGAVPDPLAREARNALAALLADLSGATARLGLFLRHDAEPTGEHRAASAEAVSLAALEVLSTLERRPAAFPPLAGLERHAAFTLAAHDAASHEGAAALLLALRREVAGFTALARSALLPGLALLLLRATLACALARRAAARRAASAPSAEDVNVAFTSVQTILTAGAYETIVLRDPTRLFAFLQGARFEALV